MCNFSKMESTAHYKAKSMVKNKQLAHSPPNKPTTKLTSHALKNVWLTTLTLNTRARMHVHTLSVGRAIDIHGTPSKGLPLGLRYFSFSCLVKYLISGACIIT